MTKIDRKELVERHHPTFNQINKLSPLSIGNGKFAFTADVTGLQTFTEAYEVPLGTQSEWGWHYTDGPDHYELNDVTMQKLTTQERDVNYPRYPEGHEEAYHWLRQNPHRLQLGQISFRLLKENQEQAKSSDLQAIDQELNLWEGILYSHFEIDSYPVSVVTVCHPERDQIGIKVDSPLIKLGRLQIALRFPSPDMTSQIWEETTFLNWDEPNRHQSILKSESKQSAIIERSMDKDHYQVKWSWNAGVLKQSDSHEFTLFPKKDKNELSCVIGFSKNETNNDPFPVIYEQSKEYWKEFWESGGIVDFSGSKDIRAPELERRVILSQFLIDLHSSGSVPPQETGLVYNSWFGKFHLEMHWWHAANLPIWGRGNKLAKSMDWYLSILPIAKELAESQGYEGARWPKMIGIDGKQSPSEIATVLIWQQPHPIFMAELCYRENPNEDTLTRWKDIIVETAHFMTSFAHWNKEKNAYILGPPLIPAQECHKAEASMNPPFELEYWKHGLQIAIKWMERLGEKVDPKWIVVSSAMAIPPHKNGVYLAHENCHDTFEKYNHDHPSMVGALGILPGVLIDHEIMRETLKRVYDEWQWETSWGWDFPMCAMTAARLGESEKALDFLLMDATKNTYLPNGHNYQDASLTLYLPGNGGLLTAVAMMVCGWKGNEKQHAPGFPKDGTWSVKYEGLHPIL